MKSSVVSTKFKRNSLFENAITEAHYRQVATKRGNSFDLADRTERSGLDTYEERALVTKLYRCRPNHRCYSPACQQCGQVEQLLTASAIEKFIGGQKDVFRIAFVTIIPPNSTILKGSLHEFSLRNLKRRIRDGLAKTSALWAMGAIDFSLNEHHDNLYVPHWSPHVHLIVGTNDIDKFRSDLQAAFPRRAMKPQGRLW
jgi:hypothetical protein